LYRPQFCIATSPLRSLPRRSAQQERQPYDGFPHLQVTSPAHIGTYALPGIPRRGAHIAGYALPDLGEPLQEREQIAGFLDAAVESAAYSRGSAVCDACVSRRPVESEVSGDD
jgi:hypothetical protein